MIPNDGCSSECRVEKGYECEKVPSICQTKCGDSVILNETCDDGNLVSNDGCSSECKLEVGWSCSQEPSNCSPVCGDGIIINGKE